MMFDVWLEKLESANFLKWEESEDDWANDTTVGNGAETITRIPRIRTFAVVARYKQFSGWDGCIDLAGSVVFWSFIARDSPLIIINKTFRMFVIIDGHNAVFDGDSFAWKGNNAFDNILITDSIWRGTSHRIFDALRFVFANFFLIFIHKNNDLTSFGYVFLA